MNYAESFQYIMNIPHFAKTFTLDRIRTLLSGLKNPEQKLRIIHVAGTNGKGSTVSMLSSILHANGQRVGTFVSPFVYHFMERILIDGTPVSETQFAKAMSKVRLLADAMDDRPNFFEILTAAALLLFSHAACDVVVLEVGLGGRWDATNVIPAPQVAMICSIGLDHTALLGDTLSKIAAEKCGIIKKGSMVVTTSTHPPEVFSVISDSCKRAGAHLVTAEKDFSVCEQSIEGSTFLYRGERFFLPLAGNHQLLNLAPVLKVAELLHIPLSDIRRGLARVFFPARLEIVSHAPLTLVDGAHNPDGMHALENAVTSLLHGRKITTIFGCLADKNAQEMTKIARRFSDTLYLVAPPSPRAAMPQELLQYASGIPCSDFSDALARARAEKPDVLLICGSLYLAGASRDAQVIIETERLVLREMTRCDLPDLCEILQDKETMVAYEHAFSDQEVEAWLQKQRCRYRENGFGLWAVISKETGEMLGQCGLTLQEIPGDLVLEVGYLLKKRHWHHGYATEAARGCMDYAEHTLGRRKITSIIRDTNLASQAVATRNGLVKVGSFTKHAYGVDMPHFIYQKD